MSYLAGISRDDIDQFWPRIVHLIAKPLVRTGAIKDYHPEDIRQFCKDGSMQCWLAHEDGQILAVGITQVIVYPQRRVLGVPFIGAEDGSINSWFEHLESLLEFAEEQGCEALRVWGRRGWERLLNPDNIGVEFDIEVSHESLH